METLKIPEEKREKVKKQLWIEIKSFKEYNYSGKSIKGILCVVRPRLKGGTKAIYAIKTFLRKQGENYDKSDINYKILIEFLKNLLSETEKYFNNLDENLLLSVATVLDPRYKESHFKNKNFQHKRRVCIIEEALKISNNTSIGVDIEISQMKPLKKIKEEENDSFWDIMECNDHFVETDINLDIADTSPGDFFVNIGVVSVSVIKKI